MAEKSIIISAEEEAILLKPIDEYVGKIQEQIDALRVEGSDKVNSLKNQIAIAKENKNLTKEEQNKIIGECKKNLEKAKATEDANKQQIAKLIADAEGFLSKHYNSEYYNIVAKSCEAEKKAENSNFEKLKADLQEEHKKAVSSLKDAEEIKAEKYTYKNKLYDAQMTHESRIQEIKDRKHDAYMHKFHLIDLLRMSKYTFAQKQAQNFENYKYTFNMTQFLYKNGLYIVIIMIFIALCIITPFVKNTQLFTTTNILNILQQASPRMFLALGVAGLILLTGTDLSVGRMVGMGMVTATILLYQRFKLAIDKMAVSNTEATVESTVDRVNSDLLDIRQIFNAANYNIVQEFDISSEKFAEQFSLLYEVNSDKIESLALYGNEGRLIASEPVAVEKENIDVTGQDWYKNAESAIENVHFSVPHIQNLYEDGLYRYHWVVSLSRYVDINDGEIPGSGVLLVDMKYSVIEDVLKQINDSSEGIYYYMISRDGQMIYHPRKTEMARGLFEENSLKASGYEEGTYEITTDGHKESVVVGNIAYTGWKLIGVVPESVQTARINNFRYYIFTTIMVLMMMLLEGNRLISRKISKPIRKLDESVKTYEAGGKPDIYIGGSSEIRHLGYSVQRSYERIETLMEEIIRQQNERRKSELDALQSQINPHFLYNTLESITWMIEAQKNEEAVIMISELAKLLRVSLSRGKTIIPVKDELQHSRSYMNIQLVRYKERFQMEFQTDKEIEDYCIVKLVIQPILENAIYYGVGNMDEDDEGKITVRGEKKEDDIYIIIEDNGMGMRKEVLENILKDNNKVPKHGSGVGVINVHSRIQLMFGEQYGLEIYSEPDEGTRVVIHIPAIPYTKENAEQLEMQKYIQGRDVDEKE